MDFQINPETTCFCSYVRNMIKQNEIQVIWSIMFTLHFCYTRVDLKASVS